MPAGSFSPATVPFENIVSRYCVDNYWTFDELFGVYFSEHQHIEPRALSNYKCVYKNTNKAKCTNSVFDNIQKFQVFSRLSQILNFNQYQAKKKVVFVLPLF